MIYIAFIRTESEGKNLSWAEFKAGMVMTYPNAIIEIITLLKLAMEESKSLSH